MTVRMSRTTSARGNDFSSQRVEMTAEISSSVREPARMSDSMISGDSLTSEICERKRRPRRQTETLRTIRIVLTNASRS